MCATMVGAMNQNGNRQSVLDRKRLIRNTHHIENTEDDCTSMNTKIKTTAIWLSPLLALLLGYSGHIVFPLAGQYPSQFAQIADAVCDRPQEARARFFAAVNDETHRATVAHSCAEDER